MSAKTSIVPSGAHWILRRSRPPSARLRRRVQTCAARDSLPPLVVLECDGVVVDLHTDGHRVAFNDSFAELGLECANWSPEIYQDLIRSGDGSEEGLVKLFFSEIGWPSTVATADHATLASKIVEIKRRKLKEMLLNQALPLRQGVMSFVDEVLEHDAVVAVLTETQSDRKDGVWEHVKPLFGVERSAKIQSIAWPETASKVADVQDAMQEEIRRKKREEAEAFVSSINARRREKQVGMQLDPSLLQTTTSVDPSFFLTMAVALGSSVSQCVLLSAHNAILQSASSSGVLCGAVPAGLSSRHVFSGAHVRFDGFGAGGGASWPRIESLLKQRQPQ